MVPYTMKLVLPLLTCYVIVEGFYVTQEDSDVRKLRDLLLGYMSDDAFVNKLNANMRRNKWSDILDYTLNDDMNEQNSVEADNDVYYNHLSDIYLRPLLADFDKRKRTDVLKSTKDPCKGILISGPFLRLSCPFRR